MIWHAISALPGKEKRMFSHLKCLCGQRNTVSAGTMLRLAAGWAGMFEVLETVGLS